VPDSFDDVVVDAAHKFTPIDLVKCEDKLGWKEELGKYFSPGDGERFIRTIHILTPLL
jgi:hypothetical protein